MRRLRPLAVGAVLFAAFAVASPRLDARQVSRREVPDPQGSVTNADLQRLQDLVYDTGADIARLRSRDARIADDLQGQLDDLRDEVVYLKVKLRKEGTVQRNEYRDLRDRIEDLRADARNRVSSEAGLGAPPPPTRTPPPPPEPRTEIPPPEQPRTSNPYEVPVGTDLDVRLQTALSSATAQVEDRFDATTMVDLSNGSHVLIPAGSVVRGIVTSVNKAGRLDRRGSLTLSFDQVIVNHRSYPIRATVDQVLESEGVRGEVGRIGAGAGVGAIIGGILGGAKGALAGILIGGGGTVAATTGKDVELQPGTVVRMRFDEPLTVR